MLWKYMKNMGHKHLMLKTWGCKRGFSQSNDGDCNLWGGRKHQIQLSENAPSISQKTKEEKA